MTSKGETLQATPPTAEEANAAIRGFVAGRVVWPPEALAELARLRAVWAAAVAREQLLAA